MSSNNLPVLWFVPLHWINMVSQLISVLSSVDYIILTNASKNPWLLMCRLVLQTNSLWISAIILKWFKIAAEFLSKLYFPVCHKFIISVKKCILLASLFSHVSVPLGLGIIRCLCLYISNYMSIERNVLQAHTFLKKPYNGL